MLSHKWKVAVVKVCRGVLKLIGHRNYEIGSLIYVLKQIKTVCLGVALEVQRRFRVSKLDFQVLKIKKLGILE